MSDRLLRWGTTVAVLAVALIAAVISYQHIFVISLTHGEPRFDAQLIPLSIDGTVVTASLVMLRASRQGLATPWLARTILVMAIATTVAANVAFGWQYAFWGIMMAGWPAAAFLGNAEVTIGYGRKQQPIAEPAPPKIVMPAFSDAQSAAKVAYERSVAGGNPLSANALTNRFNLSRQQAAELVKASANGYSNGHAE